MLDNNIDEIPRMPLKLQDEDFKVINGFNNYKISNKGRVKSIKNANIVVAKVNKRGYYDVNLSKDNLRFTRAIHRLVATAFLIKPGNGYDIVHLDNNKLNNNLQNLEYRKKVCKVNNKTKDDNNIDNIDMFDLIKLSNNESMRIYIRCFVRGKKGEDDLTITEHRKRLIDIESAKAFLDSLTNDNT